MNAENTIPTHVMALQLGADVLETDVRLTLDREMVRGRKEREDDRKRGEEHMNKERNNVITEQMGWKVVGR